MCRVLVFKKNRIVFDASGLHHAYGDFFLMICESLAIDFMEVRMLVMVTAILLKEMYLAQPVTILSSSLSVIGAFLVLED